MTKSNHSQNSKIEKVAPKPDKPVEELARSHSPAKGEIKLSKPATPSQPPAAPQPAADLQDIPKDYGFEQSENEGTALADVAFDAVERAFQQRAQERAQRFVQMANATMASFANGMAARSAEIRASHLPPAEQSRLQGGE
jgi:hypothetical protein